MPQVDDLRRLRPEQVLALQRSIGNGAVGRMLSRAVGRRRQAEGRRGVSTRPARARTSASAASLALIDDPIKRVFVDHDRARELRGGDLDHVGDVVTQAAGTFWFRLPLDKLTVIGEEHHNKDGNVEDVIRALRRLRWMYEPFNELGGRGRSASRSPRPETS